MAMAGYIVQQVKRRKLLFWAFDELLVRDATGWPKENHGNETDFPSPFFDFDDPDRLPFYNIHELKSVEAMYKVISNLSRKDLDLKFDKISDKNIKYKNKFPLDLDFHENKYWSRKAIWCPIEAILLSLGIWPEPTIVKLFECFDSYQARDAWLIKEFHERLTLLKTANNSGQLNAKGDPGEIVLWFLSMGFLLPDGFVDYVGLFHGDLKSIHNNGNTEEGFLDQEKNTLLKLIAGMAIKGYCFDPVAKRNNATRDIQNDLDQLGLGLDQKTILKWLREATSLVDPKDLG
jgi:hypothetical protein